MTKVRADGVTDLDPSSDSAAEPTERPADTEDELKRLTVAELKRRLVQLGKPVKGTKAELVARCLE